MKISLCTTSMNRLSYLEHTLPKNVEHNADFPDVEFVILNYNSSDGMDDWIRQTQMHLIESGRLVYVHEKTARSFRPAHSRNVCARMATGDVICNVDADNYTGPGFAAFLHKAFCEDEFPTVANSYDLFQYEKTSTHGRIALRKWHFLLLGGYDERLVGWGVEDFDLNRRCLRLGFRRCVIPPDYLEYIDHDDVVRSENIDFSCLKESKSLPENKKKTNKLNLQYCFRRSDEKKWVANEGLDWGHATVCRNFSEVITLPPVWPSL